MSRRGLARSVFLAVTAAAVALELLYAFDGDVSTEPWTDYLIRLPWWVLVPLVLGFSAWLPVHLTAAKRRKERG